MNDAHNGPSWAFSGGNYVDLKAVDDLANKDPKVREAEALRVPDGVLNALSNRKVNAELAALRLATPGLPVTMLPSRCKVFVSAGVNDFRDVQLPSDAELVRFYAPSDVVFYVSFGGRVVFPIAESDPYNGWNDYIITPVNQWYFVGGGSKSFSLGLPFAGQVVSIGVL